MEMAVKLASSEVAKMLGDETKANELRLTALAQNC